MKKLTLVLLIVTALGCKNKNEAVSVEKIGCQARDGQVTAIDQAAKYIIGTWKLTKVEHGWVANPELPDEKLIFKENNIGIIIRNGAIVDTISYAVQTPNRPNIYPLVSMRLSTSDTIRKDDVRGVIGKPALYICETEMVLDYGNGWGTAVDGSVYTYRCEVK